MTNSIFRLGAITLAALTLSPPLFAQDPAAHMDMHGQHAMASSPNAAIAPFDLQFIDTMSVHHQSAMEMARLVDQRSAHDELKQMAMNVIKDQQKEIQQLQDWKKQWYPGKEDAVNMRMPGMRESMKGMSMDKLAAASGNAFDMMFLDMMGKHHQGAIKMARNAVKKAKRSELKEFARKIVDVQSKEMAQMAQWKKEWTLASK